MISGLDEGILQGGNSRYKGAEMGKRETNLQEGWAILFRYSISMCGCWRRSPPVDPPPVIRMYNLPTVPTVGTVFMDAALREKCAVKTIWTVYKLNPVKASIET